jgi:hypothetical protein
MYTNKGINFKYRTLYIYHILRTIKRRKANWIGHILRRHCLLKHVIEDRKKDRSDGMKRKNM